MRVLFAIGGFGLGNSTRCAALIDSLRARGLVIDVATSGNGLWYFSGSSAIGELVPLEPLAYAGRGGRLALLTSLLQAPRSFFRLVSNAFTLLKLQRKNRYSFIVVDSEYSCFLVRELLGVPLVALNNVFFTLSLAPSVRVLGRERIHSWIEKLDLLVQSFRSDLQIAPVLDPGRVVQGRGILFCPPLVRRGIRQASRPRVSAQALVIASGSGLGISSDTVRILSSCQGIKHILVAGIEGPSCGKVTYLGKRRDALAEFAESDFVVTNAGFSAISEALVARRPLLLLPIRNHFEQRLNAAFIEAAGLGLVTSQERLSADLEDFLRSMDERSSRPVPEFDGDGAEMAAEFIFKAIGDRANDMAMQRAPG